MNRYGIKNNLPHVKGMIFAGCSFTWGQGLHYYNNTPTFPDDDHHNAFNYSHVSPCHYEFIRMNRFAGIVSKHFNCYQFVNPKNGGSPDAILKWWEDNIKEEMHDLRRYLEAGGGSYDPRDISHFVLQCTQWSRSLIRNEKFVDFFQDKINYYENDFFSIMTKYRSYYEDFLKLHNLTNEEFIEIVKQENIDLYKKMLMKFENQGIKTYIFTWPKDMIPLIEKDPWLNNRLLKFSYRDIAYDNLEDLMNLPNMMVVTDRDTFENPPFDNHPSLLCHQIIAKSIIEKIEKTIKL
jgi:hypothetical protein